MAIGSGSRGLMAAAFVAFTIMVPAAQEKAKPDPQKAVPAAPEFKDLDSFMKSLPAATVKPLEPQSALLFTALPLACMDDLQPRPTARPYFWQPTYRTVENHDKVRAFYGCSDWSTAVNATWTIVTLLKKYPDLPVSGLIREKLTDHLGRQNLEGELGYFKNAPNFQRPYGHAWLLKLYAELSTWKDPDGARYSDNVAPLARQFADSLIAYLVDLDRPVKMAGQTNTAFALGLLLDYSDITRDTTINRAVSETAKRLFLADTNCTTDAEASSPEMVSPCLAEAAIMSRVLDQPTFVAWFDKFMPAAFSPKFKPLTSVNLDAVGTGRGGRGRGGRGAGAGAATTTPPPATPPATPPTDAAPPAQGERPPAAGERGAGAPATPPDSAAGAAGAGGGGGRGGPPVSPKAAWTGLAFTRADAYARIARALPPNDARVAVYKRLAAIHMQTGQTGLNDPAAFDAPWLGSFAVSYLTTFPTTGGN
jgi:hypothetical protein